MSLHAGYRYSPVTPDFSHAVSTVKVPSIGTDKSELMVLTQIRLFLKEPSHQSLIRVCAVCHSFCIQGLYYGLNCNWSTGPAFKWFNWSSQCFAGFNYRLFVINIKISWSGGPATTEIRWSCPKITGHGQTDRWLIKSLCIFVW